MNNEQRKWLNVARHYGGSFVKSFAETCFKADDDNFAMMEPALNLLMIKYPKYSNWMFPEEKEVNG